MLRRLSPAFLAGALFLAAPSEGLVAQGFTPGQTSPALPLPNPLLAALGARPEPLSLDELIDASLLSSGVGAEGLPAAREGLGAVLGRAAAAARIAAKAAAVTVPEAGPEILLAEAALKTLHEGGPLRGYRAEATTLFDILDRGAFNCVSSALLYLLLCRELGLACDGIQTSDHAFCVVRAGGRDIDVETTNPEGFDPGTKKNFTDSFGRVTGYAYVPPGAYARRKPTGQRGLVSLVLSNRAGLLEDRGLRREALALAVDYEVLRRDAEGMTFLIGRINNLCAAFAARSDWTAFRALVGESRSRLGDDPRLLDLAIKGLDGYLSENLARLSFAPALALVEEAARKGELSPARRTEFLVYLYGNEANRVGRAGDWLAAAALAEEGAEKAGGERSLVAAAAAFRRNFAVGVHNAFATKFNAGRYAEAKSVLEEGLRRLPGDAGLLADLVVAEKALVRP